jgi:acyl carrier protein
MENKIKKIIVDVLGGLPSQLTLETEIENLGADELDEVEIIMALEQEFLVEIPDTEAEKLKTVGDIIELIKRLVR